MQQTQLNNNELQFFNTDQKLYFLFKVILCQMFFADVEEHQFSIAFLPSTTDRDSIIELFK